MTTHTGSSPRPGFAHEALLYAGARGFVEGTIPFIREGVACDEPVLVVVAAEKIRMLRSALGGDADRVHFADMAEVGHNPARIIPAWQDFIDASPPDAQGARGIGEPIDAGRDPAALVECQRHEVLLNVAFADSGPWTLLCPYDTSALPADVISEAEHSHPIVVENGEQRESPTCLSLTDMAAPFDAPLPDPPDDAHELAFQGQDSLARVRNFVWTAGGIVGFDPARRAEYVLAVNEIATNSVRYGGGGGTLRIWRDGGALVCEVRDRGRIDAPLAGRERPLPESTGGRGLWMVNQLCDLVQMRTADDGSVVRVHGRISLTSDA
jgi:anti-sigma regulatory factor (Ser/Thr protein kinase)